jgi:hypothetical protein
MGHGCALMELVIAPLPGGASREDALYPDGAHLKDLKEIRGLLYSMQRPGVSPEVSLNLACNSVWTERALLAGVSP